MPNTDPIIHSDQTVAMEVPVLTNAEALKGMAHRKAKMPIQTSMASADSPDRWLASFSACPNLIIEAALTNPCKPRHEEAGEEHPLAPKATPRGNR